MKKYFLILIILFLISLTTITKNSSKTLENKIYNKKDNIILLDRKYNLILLEHNYLTSPQKLFNYSENIKKELYIPIDITSLNKIIFSNNRFKIKKFTENE